MPYDLPVITETERLIRFWMLFWVNDAPAYVLLGYAISTLGSLALSALILRDWIRAARQQTSLPVWELTFGAVPFTVVGGLEPRRDDRRFVTRGPAPRDILLLLVLAVIPLYSTLVLLVWAWHLACDGIAAFLIRRRLSAWWDRPITDRASR